MFPQVGAPLAVASNGDVIVANTVPPGDLHVRRFTSNFGGTLWNVQITNGGSTPARVEPNSLSTDPVDNVILAGGFDFGGLTGFGHYMQRFSALSGGLWGTLPLPPADLNNTYWRGVITSGADDIFATGDLIGHSSIDVDR
jgi:hypothetical protein